MKKARQVVTVTLLVLGMHFGLSICIAAQGPAHGAGDSTTEQSQTNAGKILFSNTAKSNGNYQASDLISAIELNSTRNLYLNGYLQQPLTNYLQELAPGMSVEELNNNGNFQFLFYVDEALVYTEDLNLGAGSPTEKINNTVLVKPLFSELNEDSWGRFLWMRFMHFGGEQAFTEGTHQLLIEMRPYVNNPDMTTGDVISQGQVSVSVIKPHVTEQQIVIQPIAPDSGWPVSNDRYDKDLIRALNKKISQQDFKEISSIVVIKDGALLIEEYFNGSDRSTLHDPRSVGKSFASTMLGIAISEGYIENVEQTLSKFYSLEHFQNYSPEKSEVTLKDLLTMTSGFEGDDADYSSVGNEENMYPTNDWVKFTLDLPMHENAAIEKKWVYFTAGPVVLGDIVHQSVPQGLEAYSEQKLFGPLGITDYQWQYTPQSVANTAGGLQLRALDFAKYGQLYKNGGKWGEEQIIPESWVQASLAAQVARTSDEHGGHYGYLFWHDTFHIGEQALEVAYATGNGGNKIFIFTDVPLVIVITAQAYNNPYAHQQVDEMMFDYLLPAILN